MTEYLDDIQRVFLITDKRGPIFMSTDRSESINVSKAAVNLGFVGVRLRRVTTSVTLLRDMLEQRQDLNILTRNPTEMVQYG